MELTLETIKQHLYIDNNMLLYSDPAGGKYKFTYMDDGDEFDTPKSVMRRIKNTSNNSYVISQSDITIEVSQDWGKYGEVVIFRFEAI
jgi:hypothetical protein